MVRQVIVVPHNPDWSHQFERESQTIREATANSWIAIHPLGSTAIPGIYAKPIIDKPIIDILAEVADIHQDKRDWCTSKPSSPTPTSSWGTTPTTTMLKIPKTLSAMCSTTLISSATD